MADNSLREGGGRCRGKRTYLESRYAPVSGKAVVEKPACQHSSLQHQGGEVAKSEICASASCVLQLFGVNSKSIQIC